MNEKGKEHLCVLTEQTYKKLYQLELGIKSNIPMIIQGFTSAGKSFLSSLALEINNKKKIEVALSENTTNDDLLGKNIMKGNTIYFSPGILLQAYQEGKTLILNECDLAKPEILSCIIGALTKEKLIISNNEYYKNDEFNLILTMNGEIKGFTHKHRNILTSNIITKFIIIYFGEIEQTECEKIFNEQIKDVKVFNEGIKKNIIKLHNKMNSLTSNSIDPIVTLRNLKYFTILGKNNIRPRIAAEISYTARFSYEERNNNNELKSILNNLGDLLIDNIEKNEIIECFNKNNIFYDSNLLISFYLAKRACENGFHPLLIGKEGCGLTNFADLLQSIIYKKNNKIDNNNYLLCNYEITTEDLIGCQKPVVSSKNLSDLIKWFDGPVLKAAKNGSPVILDNINYSKTQIIECLNTLLETNFKENKNYKYSVIQNNEEKEISIMDNFIIIGTMKDVKNQNISKALLNRFISIYINEINIDKNNIKELIKITIKNYNEKLNEKNGINKSYNIQNISDLTLKELNKLFENEKLLYEMDQKNFCTNENFINDVCEKCNCSVKLHNLKKMNLKQIVRLITKLSILYERLKKYSNLYSMEDCYNLFEFNFDKINKKQTDTLIYDFIDVKENKEFYFEENEKNKGKNDACKMIMSLIIGDITNTTVFLQGSPGSGKTCAAKYYGANRKFNKRDPIITINCHKDLTIEYLIGDYCFKNEKFEFIEGPLLNALEEGVPILLDEFNLCSESLLINLSPIFKAKINDIIFLKGMNKPKVIKPGFLLIATGNFQNEKGRNAIPSFISDEIKTLKIESNDLNYDILQTIMERQYNLINKVDENDPDKYKISAKQIKAIFEDIYNITQEKFYLRQIKCLLERIQRFYNADVFTEQEEKDFEDLKIKKDKGEYKLKIPVIYIIISYIFPQLRFYRDVKDQLLEKINEKLKYNNLSELIDFINSEVKIEKYEGYENKFLNVIRKGKIYLKINDNFNGEYLPQIMKETFFWIRMTCNARNDAPQDENILLSGLTSYKTYLLYKWLDSCYDNYKGIYDTFYLTQKSETQDLLGTSTLDNDKDIAQQIKDLEEAFKKNKDENCKHYIQLCIEKLENLKNSYNGKIPLYSFHLGPLTKSYIYGKKIIIKGIENPHPSVIERLNPILESPRNLVLIEDNQKIFNDQKILDKTYGNLNNEFKSYKTSIPINPRFSLFLTSREIYNEGLSKAFLTRCTVIYCKSYEVNENKGLDEDNFERICSNFFCYDNQPDIEVEALNKLKDEIMEIKKMLEKKTQIEYLKFIRWCKSTLNIYSNIIKYKFNTILYENEKLNLKYIVGISALRSIIDDLDRNKRISNIEIIKSYLPKKLYNLLTRRIQTSEFELPFDSKQGYIISNYSGLILEIDGEPKSQILSKIVWTYSSLDIADAILTSLISDSILILEGAPGRGKTEISKKVFEYLNINLKRINFSISTTKEDIFSRKISRQKKLENDESITEIAHENKALLLILEESNKQKDIYKNGLILDEINLAPEELLEQLYSYLIEIKNNKKYITLDGKSFNEIGKIAIVATLNGSRLSNSRIPLSNSFLNLTHSFKIQDYRDDEIKLLIYKLLSEYLDQKQLEKVIKCYFSSKQYIIENEIITFREILKLKELLKVSKKNKIVVNIEFLLELIFCPYIKPSEIQNFRCNFENILTNFKDVELQINDDYIYFGDYIKYPRIENKKYRINFNFTINQKEAIIKILFGLNINKTILLVGDNCCGKTYIIEKLAELIGVKLKIIQFYSEISSYELIGGLEIIESDKKELIKKLEEYKNELIAQKHPKITILIELIEKNEYKKIAEILNDQSIKIEGKDTLIKKLKQTNKLSIHNLNLKFKKSFLLDAMENGYWILLDDTNLRPQELERLMSLLEEEPELNVFEENLLYTNKNSDNNNIKKINIHDNFRLIISTTNENVISGPLKSRCLKIIMNNFKKTEDYATLISNYLSNYNFIDKDIKDISIKVGNLFNKTKNNENAQEENYLLKNYFLSSVNLVYFSKLLINLNRVSDEEFSEIIKFSIFSGFKENIKEKKMKQLINALNGNNVEQIDLKIIKNIKKHHEYYLSEIERKIISLYYQENRENLDFKKLNERIKNKLNKISNLSEKNIDKEINGSSFKEFIKIKNFINDLESFTFKEIEEYITQLGEVQKAIESFLRDDLKPNFLFLNYLILFLGKIKELCVKDKNVKLSEYKGEYENRLFFFLNIFDAFEDIIPSQINENELNKSIINLFYIFYSKKYEEKNKFNSFFEMISNKKLYKILKEYNIKFPEGEETKKELFDSLIYEENQDIFILEYNEAKHDISINIEGSNIGTKYLNSIDNDDITVFKRYLKLPNKNEIKKEYS